MMLDTAYQYASGYVESAPWWTPVGIGRDAASSATTAATVQAIEAAKVGYELRDEIDEERERWERRVKLGLLGLAVLVGAGIAWRATT